MFKKMALECGQTKNLLLLGIRGLSNIEEMITEHLPLIERNGAENDETAFSRMRQTVPSNPYVETIP